MSIDNLSIQMKYEVLSDQLGVMTVAFYFKCASDWVLSNIISGESYDMLHRLENWSN